MTIKFTTHELEQKIDNIKIKIKQDTFYYGLTEFIIDVIAESKSDKSFNHNYCELLTLIDTTMKEISVFRDDLKRDLLDILYQFLISKSGFFPDLLTNYPYEELEHIELIFNRMKHRFTPFIKNRRLIKHITETKLLTIVDEDANEVNKLEPKQND